MQLKALTKVRKFTINILLIFVSFEHKKNRI